jgi:hypothetical protein
MTRKIIFTHLFTEHGEPNRFASSIVTLQGYKDGMVALAQLISSCMTYHHFSASFPTTKKRGLYWLRVVVSLSVLFHGRVELARI